MLTRSRPLLSLVSVLTVLICLGVTGLVIKDRLRQLDFDLTVKLQGRFPQRLDDTIALVVDLGSMEVQGIVLLGVLLFLPLSNKRKVALLLSYGIGLALVLVGKHLIPQPAPPYMFQRGNQGLAFPSLHVQVDSSYPSGHTYRVVFFAYLLVCTWIGSDKKQAVLLAGVLGSTMLACLVMLGLVVLGKHWVTDLIGGAGLAMLLVGGVFLLRMPTHGTKKSLRTDQH